MFNLAVWHVVEVSAYVVLMLNIVEAAVTHAHQQKGRQRDTAYVATALPQIHKQFLHNILRGVGVGQLVLCIAGKSWIEEAEDGFQRFSVASI